MIAEKTLHAKTALDEAEHTLHLKKPKGSKDKDDKSKGGSK